MLIHILYLFTQAPLFKNLLLKCNLTVLLQAPFSGALFQIFPPLTPANISVTAWRQVNHVRSHYRAWKQICPSRSPSSRMAIFTERMRASSSSALIPHFYRMDKNQESEKHSKEALAFKKLCLLYVYHGIM